jgi:hypothetical protein
MYEVKLDAPSGALIVGLTPDAAEAVKLAVLRALLDAGTAWVMEHAPEGVSPSAPALAMGETGEGPTAATGASGPRGGARSRKTRAGFRVAGDVKAALPGIMPPTREHAMGSARLTRLVNGGRMLLDYPEVSASTVERALAALRDEGLVTAEAGIAEGMGPRALGWYLTDAGDELTRPIDPSKVEAYVDDIRRNGFAATVEAGVGVVNGSV